MLLVDLFEIENKWLIIGLSGVMVAYPAITSTLGYMFVAPYFLFGTMVGVFGVCLACRSRKWYEVAAGLFSDWLQCWNLSGVYPDLCQCHSALCD